MLNFSASDCFCLDELCINFDRIISDFVGQNCSQYLPVKSSKVEIGVETNIQLSKQNSDTSQIYIV